MRWTPGRISPDIEDRRGSRFPGGGAGLGIGGTVVLLILSLVFGQDFLGNGGADSGAAGPTAVGSGPGGGVANGTVEETPEEHQRLQFVSFMLDDIQHTWARLLPSMGAQYHDAKLVLFRDAVQSGCGVAQSAMGPFYCPVDEKVYLDLGFYDELSQRFGAPGDFAQAYVLAHELGHHVQHLLGTDRMVRQVEQSRPELANQASVRLELQADCYAGVWGYTWAHSNDPDRRLDPGDAQEGLAAAAAVGDDRIQKEATGSVHPESFTHGTAAQRSHWFDRGFTTGDPKQCDTFSQ